MKFGKVPPGEAIGAILAHRLRGASRHFDKGMVIDKDAAGAMAEAGFTDIAVARLEPGDIGENAAAYAIAAHFLSPLLELTEAGTGRANLVARASGVLCIDRAAIDRLNRIDEAITLATLADSARVNAGDLLATLKIIPFAVAGKSVDSALAAASPDAIALKPFMALRAGLALSVSGIKDSVLAGTEAVTRSRIEARGGALKTIHHVPHDSAAIAASLQEMAQENLDLLLIAGAAAATDRADEAPAAIERAGGTIIHFGMPTDPGNLLCYGKIGAAHVIVLPGCARSPKLNGIDLLLDRIFAGLTVDRTIMTGLGVGGLLTDTKLRPAPRDAKPPMSSNPESHKITGILLAAGSSRRMGAQNKLLLPAPGDTEPMLRRCAQNLLAGGISKLTVVLGHEADAARALLHTIPCDIVIAADYAEGIAASLRAGIAAQPANCRGAIVALADMPRVTPEHIAALIAAFDEDAGHCIIVPSYLGKRGNPVLFAKAYFAEIAALTGDQGARALLSRHAEAVFSVPADDPGVLTDFDTVEAFSVEPAG
jgi:molybdenum cofactor cytidylyltransferase